MLGRTVAYIGDERRDRILARVAPDLRLLVARGETSVEDWSPRLFGRGFLNQLETQNATLQAFQRARVEIRD